MVGKQDQAWAAQRESNDLLRKLGNLSMLTDSLITSAGGHYFSGSFGDAQASAEESVIDAASMSLTELADHIEQTHHHYLRSELPRLDGMTEKVASVHGGRNPRLHQIRETFLPLAAELEGSTPKLIKLAL